MRHYLKAAEDLRDNDRQWAAYESKGHCAVLAGPGSGKTKVLTVKMARLLAEDARRPRGIACVTYNTECVRELRRRLDGLGVEESDRVFVGTLHGFCLRHILSPFGALAGRPLSEPMNVPSERDRVQLVDAAMRRLGIGGRADDLLYAMDKARRLCLDRTPEEGWDANDDVVRVTVEYERQLEAEGSIDFDTMVRTALILVEANEWLRTCLRARFPILIVDEYQDLGLALHRLVMSLCFQARVRLFAVGDPDQSIYGFTGACPELLDEVAARDDVEDVRLRLNYRSGSKIVSASKAALGQVRDYESTRDATGTIQVHTCAGSLDGQVRRVVEEIIPDIVERRKAGDVVILYPSKYEGGRLEEELAKAGHEYVRLGRDGAYQRTPLTRLIEDLARWCSGGWREGEPKLSRLLRRWTTLQRLLDPELTRRERLKLVRFLFDRREDSTANEWLAAFEEVVLATDHARTRLLSTGDVDSFDALREASRPGGRLEKFTVRNLGGQAGSPEHFNLLTLHSSKGSEFDAVILVGADEGRIPSHHAQKSASGTAEARRLFYVGVSRAREEIHLLHSPRVAGDRYQQGPSRFLEALIREGVDG
jgi:DNA helicase-2/ATP-dependent DNA helicase PcrA